MTFEEAEEANYPSYDVVIRRNVDGKVRKHHEDSSWTSDFMWTEGNYACDCNRRLFFDRADGVTYVPIDNVACGDGAYTILKIIFPDGKELQMES